MNVIYAWPLPHDVLKFSRKLDALIILAGPALFWFALGFHDGVPLSLWTPGPRGYLLAPYTCFCAALGLLVYPACTIAYWRRPRAARVLSNDTILVDVARELGHPPAGVGKYRSLTRIPGNECFRVEFSERILQVPQLPAEWDGLRILHLSDLHLCGTPDRDFYRFVMDRCMSLWPKPEIVAISGDIVDTANHHRWIIPVLGRLRWQCAAFAILGNHDSWWDVARIRRRFGRIGIIDLGNTWRQIEVRGRPMVIIGHEGPWFKPIPELSSCPPALAHDPNGVFRLCISHTPDNIAWMRQHGINLAVAGHVHGGQIRFPIIGSVFVPSRYGRYYDCGTFFKPPTLMHVSRGLAGQHPLRFNCRPEVTCLILRTA